MLTLESLSLRPIYLLILSRDWDLQLEKVYARQNLEDPGKWLRQDEKEGSQSLLRIYGSAEAELERSLESKLVQPPTRYQLLWASLRLYWAHYVKIKFKDILRESVRIKVEIKVKVKSKINVKDKDNMNVNINVIVNS